MERRLEFAGTGQPESAALQEEGSRRSQVKGAHLFALPVSQVLISPPSCWFLVLAYNCCVKTIVFRFY
jgi:hypothetical protein